MQIYFEVITEFGTGVPVYKDSSTFSVHTIEHFYQSNGYLTHMLYNTTRRHSILHQNDI